MSHKFNYNWTLKDAIFTKDKGKVFSCFACGGGSTMGYKLAGYDVIGCNEIDPRMNEVYIANHHPKHNYLMDIREMVKLAKAGDLPDELYQLDILDGSPPCSTFSTAGQREKNWGKEKVFKEGQASQVLDTLFFDFIELANLLRPKIVVAENVKGLMLGSAWEYMRNIYKHMEAAGYICQHWLLNGSLMGIPQSRERVFFVAIREDLAKPFMKQVSLFDILPVIDMEFNEDTIPCRDFVDFEGDLIKGKKVKLLWDLRRPGDINQSQAQERLDGKISNFGQSYIYLDKPSPTMTAHKDCLVHFNEPRFTSKSECCCIASFPQDYNFLNQQPWYICGMSVPPVMMAQVSSRIFECWLSKMKSA